MEHKKKNFKDRSRLSFKSSALALIRRDEKILLRPDDEAEFKALSRTYFESRTLPENRETAKKIGVESSTTLSKEELVNNILDRLWGIQYFTDSSPVLNPVELDKLPKEDELKLLEDVHRGEYLIGKEVVGVFESRDLGGILRDKRFVPSIGDCGVIRSLVGKYNLCDGDVVSGCARYVESVGFYCLHFIDKINGFSIDEAQKERALHIVRPFYRIHPVKGDNGFFRILDVFTPIYRGQSCAVSCSGRYAFSEKLCELYSSVKKTAVFDECILTVLGEREETAKRLYQIYSSGVFTCAHTDGETNASILKRIREYAVRQAQFGKHIAVFLNNLSRADYNLNGFDIRSFIDSARQYKGGGSVTIISFAESDNPSSGYFKVKDLLDMELKIKADAFFNNAEIVLGGSYSLAEPPRSQNELKSVCRLAELISEKGTAETKKRIEEFVDNQTLFKELGS